MSKESQKEWNYKPLAGRIRVYAGSLFGIGAFAFGVSQIFNPIALIAVGALSALGIFTIARLNYSKNFRAQEITKMTKKEIATPAPDTEPYNKIKKIASECAEKMNLPAPQLLIVNKKFATYRLPWWLKWHPQEIKLKKAEKAMPTLFAAFPSANILAVTKESATKFTAENKERELKFIIAHEMAHLKTDSFSIQALGKVIKDSSFKYASIGLLVCGVAALFGFSAPLALIVTSGSALSAFGSLFLLTMYSGLGLDYASRAQERRADRNAVHVTNDLPAAVSALKIISDENSEKKGFILWEYLTSHPSLGYRLGALKDTFNGTSAANKTEIEPRQKFTGKWSDIFKDLKK